MRTYIVSRDIVRNMFYPTWRVFTDDRTVSKLTATKNQLIEKGGILATKLCTHKENINQINDIHLTRLPGETKVFEATDSDSGMCAMLDGHIPVSLIVLNFSHTCSLYYIFFTLVETPTYKSYSTGDG